MANASIFLDKRFKLIDETFRIRLRVSHERKSIYIKLPYSLNEKDYRKVVTGLNMNNNADLQKIRKEVKAAEAKANSIIKDLNPFNFSVFQNFYNQTAGRNDIITLLSERSAQLEKENKFANSNLYKQASKLFAKYTLEAKKQSIFKIEELTPEGLKAFESWAVKNDYSLTTVGMYLIRTKAILNTLMRTGELNKANYPFGKKEHGLYPIPKAANAKRPLTLVEIMELYNYDAKSDLHLFAKDMFMFSYLASGMNLYDVFRLKHSDFDKDRFTFIRKKTESKKTDKITVLLNDDLRSIIERHSIRKIGNDYVFNVLGPGMSLQEENQAVRRMITNINQALKVIAKKIGIPETISTYYARHSFANILMESEAPLAFISKKLGHSDLATTQSYLSQFSKESEVLYTAKLLKKA